MSDESERDRPSQEALKAARAIANEQYKYDRGSFPLPVVEIARIIEREYAQSTASGIVRKLRAAVKSGRFEDWDGENALRELAAEIASEHGLKEE